MKDASRHGRAEVLFTVVEMQLLSKETSTLPERGGTSPGNVGSKQWPKMCRDKY